MPTYRNHVLLRVHDSGDFFSPWYFRAMLRAVGARPWVKAYGYTKRLQLLSAMRDAGEVPSNFSIVQSVGGRLDRLIDTSQPHSRVFETDADRIDALYAQGNESDMPAVRGETNIGLVYHGTEGYQGQEGHRPTDRGKIVRRDRGWVVTMPLNIKNRKFHVHEFDFSDIADDDLHNQITVKTGNVKVKKTAAKLTEAAGIKYRAAAFNLPALATCPMAGECALFCYALQGSFGFKSARHSRARTWAVLMEAYDRGGESFVQTVIGRALDAMKPREVK